MLVVKQRKRTLGRGIINSLIDNLPFEAHWPGMRFCGPGTRLEERLKRGDRGVNRLDEFCRKHDIAYFQNKDLSSRHKADEELKERAWERFKAKDASLGEKAAAYAVTNAMKAKLAMGAGVKKSKKSSAGVRKPEQVKKSKNPSDGRGKLESKLKKLKNVKAKKQALPRVIPLPKTGGFLQYLYPILTGLSQVGSAANTGKELLKNIQKLKSGGTIKRKMKLAPFRKGWGLYLRPYEPKNC